MSTRFVSDNREHLRYFTSKVRHQTFIGFFCQLLKSDIRVILTKNLKVLVTKKYENVI